MGGSGWKVGRVAGIDLAIHPSWLVIAFLLTFSPGRCVLPAHHSRLDGRPVLAAGGGRRRSSSSHRSWRTSSRTRSSRVASASRSAASRSSSSAAQRASRPSRPVRATRRSSRWPARSRAWSSARCCSGPARSFRSAEVQALVGWLGIINVVLGAFNLVPGYPMDGGRVLRAILWRLRGDPLVATRQAAIVGRLIGYLMVAGGIYWALRSRDIGSGLWLALVGWFLATAAEATLQQAGVERSLSGVRVRDAMDLTPGRRLAQRVGRRPRLRAHAARRRPLVPGAPRRRRPGRHGHARRRAPAAARRPGPTGG